MATTFLATFLALAALAALLFFILAQDIRSRVKAVACGLTALGCLAIAGLHFDLPGTPKSVLAETADVPKARVLWSTATPSRIYLMLTWPGLEEPKYYWMASTKQKAKQLRQAQSKARAQRRALMIRYPFKKFGTDDRKKNKGRRGRGTRSADNAGSNRGVFYAPPPKALPVKR